MVVQHLDVDIDDIGFGLEARVRFRFIALRRFGAELRRNRREIARSVFGVVPVVSAAGCFRGLATVSLLVPGLSCAHTPTIKVNAAAAAMIHFFIRTHFPFNNTRD